MRNAIDRKLEVIAANPGASYSDTEQQMLLVFWMMVKSLQSTHGPALYISLTALYTQYADQILEEEEKNTPALPKLSSEFQQAYKEASQAFETLNGITDYGKIAPAKDLGKQAVFHQAKILAERLVYLNQVAISPSAKTPAYAANIDAVKEKILKMIEMTRVDFINELLVNPPTANTKEFGNLPSDFLLNSALLINAEFDEKVFHDSIKNLQTQLIAAIGTLNSGDQEATHAKLVGVANDLVRLLRTDMKEGTTTAENVADYQRGMALIGATLNQLAVREFLSQKVGNSEAFVNARTGEVFYDLAFKAGDGKASETMVALVQQIFPVKSNKDKHTTLLEQLTVTAAPSSVNKGTSSGPIGQDVKSTAGDRVDAVSGSEEEEIGFTTQFQQLEQDLSRLLDKKHKPKVKAESTSTALLEFYIKLADFVTIYKDLFDRADSERDKPTDYATQMLEIAQQFENEFIAAFEKSRSNLQKALEVRTGKHVRPASDPLVFLLAGIKAKLTICDGNITDPNAKTYGQGVKRLAAILSAYFPDSLSSQHKERSYRHGPAWLKTTSFANPYHKDSKHSVMLDEKTIWNIAPDIALSYAVQQMKNFRNIEGGKEETQKEVLGNMHRALLAIHSALPTNNPRTDIVFTAKQSDLRVTCQNFVSLSEHRALAKVPVDIQKQVTNEEEFWSKNQDLFKDGSRPPATKVETIHTTVEQPKTLHENYSLVVDTAQRLTHFYGPKSGKANRDTTTGKIPKAKDILSDLHKYMLLVMPDAKQLDQNETYNWLKIVTFVRKTAQREIKALLPVELEETGILVKEANVHMYAIRDAINNANDSHTLVDHEALNDHFVALQGIVETHGKESLIYLAYCRPDHKANLSELITLAAFITQDEVYSIGAKLEFTFDHDIMHGKDVNETEYNETKETERAIFTDTDKPDAYRVRDAAAALEYLNNSDKSLIIAPAESVSTNSAGKQQLPSTPLSRKSLASSATPSSADRRKTRIALMERIAAQKEAAENKVKQSVAVHLDEALKLLDPVTTGTKTVADLDGLADAAVEITQALASGIAIASDESAHEMDLKAESTRHGELSKRLEQLQLTITGLRETKKEAAEEEVRQGEVEEQAKIGTAIDGKLDAAEGLAKALDGENETFENLDALKLGVQGLIEAIAAIDTAAESQKLSGTQQPRMTELQKNPGAKGVVIKNLVEQKINEQLVLYNAALKTPIDRTDANLEALEDLLDELEAVVKIVVPIKEAHSDVIEDELAGLVDAAVAYKNTLETDLTPLQEKAQRVLEEQMKQLSPPPRPTTPLIEEVDVAALLAKANGLKESFDVGGDVTQQIQAIQAAFQAVESALDGGKLEEEGQLETFDAVKDFLAQPQYERHLVSRSQQTLLSSPRGKGGTADQNNVADKVVGPDAFGH